MAICNLHTRRLFYFIMALSMLGTAINAGQIINKNDTFISSSSDMHAVLNRTVILNSASWHFLDLIFHKYSDNLTEKISIERFKDLLKDLTLGETVAATETSHDQGTPHRHGGKNSRSQDGESSEVSRQRNMRRRRSERQSNGERRQLQLNSKTNQIRPRSQRRERRSARDRLHTSEGHEECLTGQELLLDHDVKEEEGLNEEDFVRICPALIQQLQDKACIVDNLEDNHMAEDSAKMLHVWGYGFLSITVISLTSLLAIAVIPLMRHSIYKRIMSFLVALAVGTLSGDALLHLIPHAFVSSHGNEEGGHEINIYKSCVIMAGIYVFFMVECTLKARMARKKRSRGNLHVTTPEKMKKKEAAKYQEMVGSRLAGIQRSISCDGAHFPKASRDISEGCKTTSCELVLLESGKEERASTGSESSQEKVPLWEPCRHGHHCHPRDSVQERSKHSFSDSQLIAALQGKSCIHPNIYSNNNFSASGTDSENQTHHNVNQIRSHQGDQYPHQVPTESNTIATETTSDAGDGGYDEENRHDHHHHHHHHSPNIDKNTSIATVAWMVIVGDGFHNFSDGLAVGTAFSVSLTSGLTTAIAVFCHELPHELGDFAILLKSGLTFRQALAYNFASAIISYIGLILGIIIGDLDSAHTWVLALTAGMFLYISLVDMLPELSNYINEGGGWPVVISQNLGILTGVSIMLAIALYES